MVLKDTADNTLEKRREEVRKLCSDVNEADFSMFQLDKFMTNGDKFVQTKTSKSDWLSTDTDWQDVIHASNHMAAADFWGGIPNSTATATAQFHVAEAKDLIKGINKQDVDPSSPRFIAVYTPDYRTEPLSTRED